MPHFHADDAPLILLGDILARGRSSRLYRRLVLEEQVAQDVSAYQAGRELAGSFGINVTLRPSRSIAQARELVEAELTAMAETEVSDEELRRVQNMRMAGFFFALEHIGGFGGVADRLNAYNVFRGDPALIGSDVRRFREVTPAAIRGVLSRHVAGKPRIALSVIGREGAGKPERAGPQGRARAAGDRPLRRDLAGCGAAPVRDAAMGLPPPRTAHGRRVDHHPRGRRNSAAGASGLAQLTADMLDEGTRNRTAAQIAMEAEAMGASISASCGWDGIYVGFRCLESDLRATLDLAVDILLNPTFPEAEWRRVHGQTLAALRAERDSAESRAYRALLRALYGPEHPYRFPLAGTEESVRGLRGGRPEGVPRPIPGVRPGIGRRRGRRGARGRGGRAGPAAGRPARTRDRYAVAAIS